MIRISDPDAEQLYRTGYTSRLPKGARRTAYRRIHLLLAARELRDVTVLGQITRWSKDSNRYGIPITGKWYLDFNWEKNIGACQIRLKRH